MAFSLNLGTLTSWNPLGHSRPVTGLLYILYSGSYKFGRRLQRIWQVFIDTWKKMYNVIFIGSIVLNAMFRTQTSVVLAGFLKLNTGSDNLSFSYSAFAK